MEGLNKTMKYFMQNVVARRTQWPETQHTATLPFGELLQIEGSYAHFRVPNTSSRNTVLFVTCPKILTAWEWCRPDPQLCAARHIFIVTLGHFPLHNALWRVVWCDKDYRVALIIGREMLAYHSQARGQENVCLKWHAMRINLCCTDTYSMNLPYVSRLY